MSRNKKNQRQLSAERKFYKVYCDNKNNKDFSYFC